MTPGTTVLSLHLKKNQNQIIDGSNEIDNDINFVTHNRYVPLENIYESFNSSPGYNLLQSEINAATQDQINKNGHKQERKL